MATQDTGDQRTWQGQSAATTGKDPDRIPADLPTPAAPALKDQAPLATPAGLGDRTNMVFNGTGVTRGRGRAVVSPTPKAIARVKRVRRFRLGGAPFISGSLLSAS